MRWDEMEKEMMEIKELESLEKIKVLSKSQEIRLARLKRRYKNWF